MVKERRQIIFPNQDLVTALLEFDREQTKAFGPANGVTCVVSEDEPVRATLTFAASATQPEKTFDIDSNRLAAALLWYCMKQRIPLPKKAQKVLRSASGGVTLNFTLSHERQEPAFPLSA